MESQWAVMFPGQGSQSVGMLGELGSKRPIVLETFEEASDVLGTDLWGLCQNGPLETLNRTEYTQPAMLAAGVAAWRVLAAATQARPSVLAGHSLGEYSALVAADALDFPAAVGLVAERAAAMQGAVPEGQGAMAAILGMDDAGAMALCASESGSDVLEADNVSAAAVDSITDLRAILAEQLFRPVRWVETIQAMRSGGVQLLVEAGPGRVLTGLAKRIDRELLLLEVSDEASLAKTLDVLAP
ncbi:MAG: ACP S-malonyltransferase [Thioalkalivibrio sp.]|nr:ACP S-malonyltransferase [Thioalkalivibrio sp.]